jgi:hypothetical protein
MLKVDSESIQLPQTQLPPIDSPEPSHSPASIVQNGSQPPKPQQKPALKPETAVNNGKHSPATADTDNWRLSLQDLLFNVVSKTYQQRQAQLPPDSTQHFKFGDNQWTAYVQPNGDCFVRNESKRTVVA